MTEEENYSCPTCWAEHLTLEQAEKCRKSHPEQGPVKDAAGLRPEERLQK